MQLHNLKREHKNKKKRIIGRGGKHAKTSGRGGKGQTARATSRIRPAIRDIIKKLPKGRGYKTRSFEIKPVLVSLDEINAKYLSGEEVNPKSLFKFGIIKKRKGFIPSVKILNGRNNFNIKITVNKCCVSKSAKEKIINAGGEVIEKESK